MIPGWAWVHFTFFAVAWLLGAGAIAQHAGASIPKELSAWIEAFAASQKSGDRGTPAYYGAATLLSEGQIQGHSAAALVFTLEGIGSPNGYQQFLGLFWKRAGHYDFCCSRRVGGKANRSIEKLKVAGDGVRLLGKEYLPADAACCPSKAFVGTLAVDGRDLVEVPTASD